MNPGRYVLDNRHAMWALVLAILVFGTAAYHSLQVQLFPDTDPPVVRVITAYPGASAPDVARDVSRPMEEEFASLEGITSVQSSSEDNLSVITLEFDYRRDGELAAVETQNAISRIGDQLPADTGEPRVLNLADADGAAVTFGVVGEDLIEARRIAEDQVAPKMQRLPGVAAVDVFGGRQEAVMVELDKTRMAAQKLTLGEVVDQIAAQNAAEPAGRVRTERRETLFRVEARPTSVEALAATPIRRSDGTRLLLSELATVHSSHLDEEASFAVDGQPAVAVQLFETVEANTVDVVRHAEQLAAELNDQLHGPGKGELKIVVGDESATFAESSVNNLLVNVLQAIALAVLVIFFFLGRARASMVAAVSMPLSYGLTFVGMQWLGVDFNMVTLSALILAVGMVVDAAVVVLENIVRLRDRGMSGQRAAREGTAEVASAVLVGALTTTAVLVPLLFVPGFVGATFGPLALTLLLAFASSIAIALLVVPALSLYLKTDRRPGDHVTTRGWTDKVTSPFRAMMDGVQSVYLRLLSAALRWRTVTLVVAVASFALGIAGIKGQGMEVLPQMDGGNFYISFETPSGSSLEATNEVARRIEAELVTHPEVVTVQRQTGYERGMRSLSATGAQGPTQGFITVELTPRTERQRTIWEIQDQVRRSVESIGEVETSVVRELGNTAKSTTDAPVAIQLSGDDPLVLDALARDVLHQLEDIDELVNPVRNWQLDRQRLRVEVDRLRAGRLGISPQEVGWQMQAGSEGLSGGQFYGARPTGVPVVVRHHDRHSPTDLLAFPISVPAADQTVPLRSVASLIDETGPTVVTRQHLVQTLDITAQTGDRPLSFVMADVENALRQLTVPAGYEVVLTGERSELSEARTGLGRALLIAIAAVYLLLLAQLRSFLRPLVIMMSVPLSLIGVSAALWLTDRPVSMPVMVGLILLVGIVVNNAIILLDLVARRRADGARRRQALRDAVEVRFRPIMMTTVSTVIGMIPLAGAWALGAERFAPLAIAVMGGMIASTLLTMVVIPVIYDVLESAALWIRPT